MKLSTSFFIFVVVLSMLGVVLLTPYTYAAGCSASKEDAIEEEYDEAIEDFDEIMEEDGRELFSLFRDIQSTVERGGRGDAVELALREARNGIRDIEDEADDIHDGYSGLASRSSYESCEDEIKDFADDLEVYFEDEIDALWEGLDKTKKDAGSLSSIRSARIQAPVWEISDTIETEQQNTPANVRVATSIESSPSGALTLEQKKQIMAQIKALMQEIIQLLALLKA